MSKRTLTALATVAIAALIAPGALAQVGQTTEIEAGSDIWSTVECETYKDFSEDPIPADFFGPGSLPFTERIELHGVPLGEPRLGQYANTVVSRLENAILRGPGSSATVPIQLEVLALQTAHPIMVGFSDNTYRQYFVDVQAYNPRGKEAQPVGSMTIRQHDEYGGTFDSVLPIHPRFTFWPVEGGPPMVLEDPAYNIELESKASSFLFDNGDFEVVELDSPLAMQFFPGVILPPTSDNFFAGMIMGPDMNPACDLSDEEQKFAKHGVLPARFELAPDTDGDCVPDDCDNCPDDENKDQRDSDRDGVGDVCDEDTPFTFLNGNFKVWVDWTNHAGETGSSQVVPFGSDDSGLIWFFQEDNWEMLVKVVNGCPINDHYWMFSAATTDVGYTLHVMDLNTGEEQTYVNELGQASPAITDINAFASCAKSAPGPGEGVLAEPLETKQTLLAAGHTTSLFKSSQVGDCTPSESNLCLNDQRFRVEVSWRDHAGNTGGGQVVPIDSTDSGVFWFFDENNWEMLIKVLNGCGLNSNYWVFAAATTDVETR